VALLEQIAAQGARPLAEALATVLEGEVPWVP
jgi:hypothetical protein